MLNTTGVLSFTFSRLNSSRITPETGAALGPRLGRLSLQRLVGQSLPSPQSHESDIHNTSEIEIPTPNLWAYTSRGVVPHLTKDNVARSSSIKGLHIPLESYLETNPPIPTLFPGPLPLHSFHGYDPSQMIVSLGLRDPNDAQVLRANGQNYVIAQCVRGSKQVVPKDFHQWATKLQPDVLFALPDIPSTSAPFSQKRMTKSNERTLRWLTDLTISRQSENLGSKTSPTTSGPSEAPTPAVFVHLVGGAVEAARDAFSESLLEPLIGHDADLLPHLGSIDDAVDGYVLDLVPVRLASAPISNPASHARAPTPPDALIPLMQSSLRYLPERKPSLVTGVSTPHEVLRLVSSVGVDIFDSFWAQRAADHGIALDFRFPLKSPVSGETSEVMEPNAGVINLYDEKYAMDFRRLSECFETPSEVHQKQNNADESRLVCDCLACSPDLVSAPLTHGSLDRTANPPASPSPVPPTPHFTRAYIHHLLHTHEMSAHSFLAAHNFAVLSAFFGGIREVLAKQALDNPGVEGTTLLEIEIERFERAYDERLLWGSESSGVSDGTTVVGILEEGERRWKEVEDLRGKGRLKREKEAAAAAAFASTEAEES
ncbi:tRNA-guanine transglycosylase [Clavulina sp. PMI_390]|nr:tRNA-guanine transglycosylase [Clavulina sp. PMI_390]